MFVSEYISPSLTLSVIFLATDKNSDQCAFASTFAPKHCDFYVNLNALYFVPSYLNFTDFSFMAFLYLSHH